MSSCVTPSTLPKNSFWISISATSCPVVTLHSSPVLLIITFHPMFLCVPFVYCLLQLIQIQSLSNLHSSSLSPPHHLQTAPTCHWWLQLQSSIISFQCVSYSRICEYIKKPWWYTALLYFSSLFETTLTHILHILSVSQLLQFLYFPHGKPAASILHLRMTANWCVGDVGMYSHTATCMLPTHSIYRNIT